MLKRPHGGCVGALSNARLTVMTECRDKRGAAQRRNGCGREIGGVCK